MTGQGASLSGTLSRSARNRLEQISARVQPTEMLVQGRLTRAIGLTYEARGFRAQVGSRCRVFGRNGEHCDSEVVGFRDSSLLLMPSGDMTGLSPGSIVQPLAEQPQIPAGNALLGRVLDSAGKPIDGLGDLLPTAEVPLNGAAINPMQRPPIDTPLQTGVRAIDSLLTIGFGQRIGLFAGSGVGKSVLLGMLTRFCSADVIVIGLIGERGREVREFTQSILDDDARRRAVVVATPADQPPLARLQGVWTSARIAESFAEQGHQVLLLIDSLTRCAQAQREIGLSIGEPPATRGYPPSSFAQLPRIVERAGRQPSGGSVTGIYTVLTEGDDLQDPIADAARAILDGHIVLARSLAERGHFPAIDVERSLSRLFSELAAPEQQKAAHWLRRQLALQSEFRDLVAVGAYERGRDPEADNALAASAAIERFLRQEISEQVSMDASLAGLLNLPSTSRVPLANHPDAPSGT